MVTILYRFHVTVRHLAHFSVRLKPNAGLSGGAKRPPLKPEVGQPRDRSSKLAERLEKLHRGLVVEAVSLEIASVEA